jgi:SAM-dependent methyltransferase
MNESVESKSQSTPESPSAITEQSPPTRWEQQVVGDRWTFYADRFDKMIADGSDLEGEARFVDAMLARDSTVLDAGCGTGRIAAALKRKGHRSIGVDKDAGLVRIAKSRYQGVPYLARDLLLVNSEELQSAGGPPLFDVIVLPGNVMVYLAPGTERTVLENLAGLLRPAGRIVAGFATDRDYTVSEFKADAELLGLAVEFQFATWQMDAVTAASDWAVVVLRGSGVLDPDDGTTTWSPATRWPRSAV